MSSERLKARLRLEEPETVHLESPDGRGVFCGCRPAWDRVTSADKLEDVTCAACRALAVSRLDAAGAP